MLPLPKQQLIETIRLNSAVAGRQLREISHAEALIQPPFQANCMNWVLGHLLTGRDTMLGFMNLPRMLSAEENERYTRGSQPIDTPEMAISLESLKERLDTSLAQITAALEARTQEELDAQVNFGEGGPLSGVIAFLLWHETYHIGQLELLRQLAGKNDQVIK
jgi:hypothetical protein